MSEYEAIQRQFLRRSTGMLLCGGITLVWGAVCVVLGLNEVLTQPATPLVCSLTLAVFGAVQTALGLWCCRYAGARDALELPDGNAILVRENKIGVVLGYVVWVVGAGFSLGTAVMCVQNDTACWLGAGFSALVLLGAFALWSDYRNRRMVLRGTQVDGVSAFGRPYDFALSEVDSIKLNLVNGSHQLMNADGKRLAMFEMNMHGAFEFLQAVQRYGLHDSARGAEIPVVNTLPPPLEWDADQETWQTAHAAQIRVGFWVLVAANAAGFVLALALLVKDILQPRYFFTVLGLLPLTYLAYALIFRQVCLWTAPDKARVTPAWNKRHVCILFCGAHFVLNYMFFVKSLSIQTNYIHGAGAAVAFGAVLCAAFWLALAAGVGKRPFFKSQLAVGAVLALLFALFLTDGLLLTVSGKAEHSPAQVISHWESEGDSGTWYYADVQVDGATPKQFTISEAAYEHLEEGGSLQLCRRTTWFGITLGSAHPPEG